MNRHNRRAAAVLNRAPAPGSGLLSATGLAPPPKRIKVAVCVPSGDEMKSGMAFQMLALTGYSMTQGILVWFQNFRGSSISHSRNALVELVLQHNPDYLLWLDSDMVFPHDTLVRLLNHQKDIVGACYCKRAPPYNLLGQAITPDRDLSDKHGLEPMAFMPGGCILVAAPVYKIMQWPWYFETYHRYNRPGPNPPSYGESLLQSLDDSLSIPLPPQIRAKLAADEELMAWANAASPLELTTLKPYNIGEDYSFSKKARRMGFELWCDLDLTREMGHIGEQVVTLGPKAGEAQVAEAAE